MFEAEIRNQSAINRLHNMTNKFQGEFKKVLCICSAGLLRSPTTAWVLSQDPYNYNTRAVGVTSEYALIPLDFIQLSWCDEVVVMEEWMIEVVKKKGEGVLSFGTKKIHCLNIEDAYGYRHPELVQLIKKAYDKAAGLDLITEESQKTGLYDKEFFAPET